MATTFDQWVEARLLAHGAYAGTVDGAPGRRTIEALERFQRAEGLLVTGMANSATVEALRRSTARSAPLQAPAVPAEPVWMREARRHMGLREVPGPGSNPVIIGWAKRVGGWVANFYRDDDTPWCGLAVAAWIAITLPKESLPANPLGALNWRKFGVALAEPALGAILVFKRDGGGHVGEYAGEDDTHFHVLGANQNNSVSITRISKDRLVAVRWPSTADLPTGGRVRLTAKGVPVTRNEA
ncbi:TIGR02594 family protein [Shinella sp. G-2]|uniref:TIGR02594 family protein n=1 Tax=Shinella sp. G-2 TaxID=3133141 RepID=UPI003D0928BA